MGQDNEIPGREVAEAVGQMMHESGKKLNQSLSLTAAARDKSFKPLSPQAQLKFTLLANPLSPKTDPRITPYDLNV